MAAWRWALVGLVFTIPLAIDPFAQWAFLPVKEAVLVAVASTVLLIAVFAWTIRGRRCEVGSNVDMPMLTVAGLLVGWLLVIPLPGAVNRVLHLLAAVQLLSMVAVGGLTVVALSERSADWRRRIFGGIAVSGAAVASIAILQAIGADPIELIAGGPLPAEGRWRIVATLGNPTWVAEYLATVLPISLGALLLSVRERRWRYLPILAVAVFAVAIVATGSRLGVLSMLAGLATWVVTGRDAPLENRLPRSVGVAAVLIVVIGLPLGGSMSGRWLSVDSISGRIGLAGASVELIRDAPVFGHGLEHYRIGLPDGLRSFARQTGSRTAPRMPRTLVDHADNDLLELAVEGGLPAAILMIALWVLAIRRALTSSLPAHRAAGASLVVLAVSSLGSAPLHTSSTVLLFWVLVGVLAVDGSDPATRTREISRPIGFRATVLAALVLATILVWRFATDTLVTNRQARQAQRLVKMDEHDAGEMLYREILDRTPWHAESRLDLGGLLIARASYEDGLGSVRESQRWRATQRAWLLEARALAATGRLEDGISVLEAGAAAVPEARAVLVELGELYLASGRTEEAAGAFRRALESRQRAPNAERLNRRARAGLAQVMD